jgi:hypothetical protein
VGRFECALAVTGNDVTHLQLPTAMYLKLLAASISLLMLGIVAGKAVIDEHRRCSVSIAFQLEPVERLYTTTRCFTLFLSLSPLHSRPPVSVMAYFIDGKDCMVRCQQERALDYGSQLHRL